MSELKRYGAAWDGLGNIERPDGQFCLAAEARSAIAKRDAEIERLMMNAIERSEFTVKLSDELAALRAENAENAELVEDLRDGLDRSCGAIDNFGFRSDECGGPHLSECIEKLGKERDELRERVRMLKATLTPALAHIKTLRFDALGVDPERGHSYRDEMIDYFEGAIADIA